jgi:hypothetical protein
MTIDVVILISAAGLVALGFGWLVHKTTLALARLCLEVFGR